MYLSEFTSQPMNLFEIGKSKKRGKKDYVPLLPPQGVDAGVFYDLVDSRKRFYENLLAASSAFNNTSIVFCLEWHGNKLLFTGDAQELSWETMYKKGVLEEVDFLKVSHHGAENGTPSDEILDKIFPEKNKDSAVAVVSTVVDGPHDSIPDKDTLDVIKKRCKELHRLDLEALPGKYIDIHFFPK